MLIGIPTVLICTLKNELSRIEHCVVFKTTRSEREIASEILARGKPSVIPDPQVPYHCRRTQKELQRREISLKIFGETT